MAKVNHTQYLSLPPTRSTLSYPHLHVRPSANFYIQTLRLPQTALPKHTRSNLSYPAPTRRTLSYLYT